MVKTENQGPGKLILPVWNWRRGMETSMLSLPLDTNTRDILWNHLALRVDRQ